ncbi:MAG: hypothetical protein GY708_20645 [Actinomycetia bacterium]|nr:hypothetical protein [Actinomycetes bacterium]
MMAFGPAGEEETAIMLGRKPGWSIVSKFGQNSDIDTANPEDIWHGGGEYTGQPVGASTVDVAETCELFSAEAADSAAGTGARTVRLQGLDENGDPQSEDVTLDGTTPVATVGLWYRVNRLFVLTAGSGEVNAGIITVRHTSTTANVFAQVPAEHGQTLIAATTIPAGHTGYLRRYSASMFDNTNNRARMAFWSRPMGGAVRIQRTFVVSTSDAASQALYGGPSFPALTDLKMRCTAVQNNNGNVTADFDLLLVRDS